MDKEYVMHIAQTIKEQLVSLTPMPILMSWGIGDFVATVFRDLPALRIKVNGCCTPEMSLSHSTAPIIMRYIC